MHISPENLLLDRPHPPGDVVVNVLGDLHLVLVGDVAVVPALLVLKGLQKLCMVNVHASYYTTSPLLLYACSPRVSP